MKRPTQEELLAEIGEWNRRFPVGTAVNSQLYPDRVHKTRTDATILFDQKAVIYLDGFNGYFDLREISPIEGERSVGPVVQATQAVDGETKPPAAESPPTSASRDEAPRKKVVVLFPGQGAQNKGMGKDLFPAFPELTQQASEILGYSIEQLCLDDPNEHLNQTQYTQSALYVVGALGYFQRKQRNDPHVDADFFMGHSLGEYNALLAADVFDFETGLRLVMKRGELMAVASGGAMAAVVRVGIDKILQVLGDNALDAIDVANYNTPTQTVISGPSDAVARAVKLFGKAKITAMPLKVSAAFHSRYMRDARDEFAQFLRDFSFKVPSRPVIANMTAKPYAPERIAETLAGQIASPVLWSESVRYVLTHAPIEFTEVGSTILGKMVKEIRLAMN